MRTYRLTSKFLRLTAIACLLVAATQLAVAATVIHRKVFDPEPFPLPDATVNVPLNYDVSHSCPANPSETNGYQWADPNAVPGLEFSPAGIISGTPTTAGTYVFSATILPSPSCEVSNTGQFQLIVKAQPAPTGCTVTADGANPLGLNAPKLVTLAARCANGNPTSFAWSANAGLPNTAAGGAVQVSTTQTYTVTPANASGNGNAVSVTVTVPPVPSGCTVTADGVNPLDLGTPKQVTLFAQCSAGNPTSFAWSANAGLPSPAAGGQVLVSSTQTFTVTPANASGAGTTASVVVNVARPAAPPSGCSVTADGANPLNLSAPKQVTLSAQCATGDPTSFVWSANAGLSVGQASGQVQVNSTQTYTVAASNAGGPGNIASVTVSVGALASSAAPGTNGQVGQANSALPAPLVLQVNDLAGNPVAGVSVSWVVTLGTGTLSAPVSLTNAQGEASVTLTLGPEPGPRTVRSTAANAAPVFFVVQSAEEVIIAPAQQTATVQQLVAINAARAQIANVRDRLDQLRQLRNPAVAQGLSLSYDGRPLPWQLLAQAAAPTKTDAAPAAADAFERNGVYVQGDIEVGHQNNVGSANGFDLRTKGVTLGADHRFDGNHVLGVALGLLRADTTLRNDGGTQDAKGYSFSAYGSYSFAENGYINLIGNVGRNDYDGERNVADGGSASSSTSGTQYGVALSAGYDFYRGSMSIGPYGRAEYVHARIDAYTETGPQALGIGEQTASATFLTLGGQANWAVSTSWGVFQPNARLEWQYQSSGGGNVVSARLISQPGSNVAVQIAGQDKSYGLLGVGAQFILPHSVQAYFNFETPFGKSDYSGQRYSLGVRVGL